MRLALVTACLLSLSHNAIAGDIFWRFPNKISPSEKYLFYIHGKIIETDGVSPISPRFGLYQFHRIVTGLAKGEANVIARVRRGETDPNADAFRLGNEIRYMLKNGVPAAHISVAGFSKGGYITLLAANRLQNADIRYVVMAGCTRGIVDGSDTVADGLQGTIMSMSDAADDLGFSCRSLFDRSPQLAASMDVIFETGKGHGLFYRADPAWMEPLLQWVEMEKLPDGAPAASDNSARG